MQIPQAENPFEYTGLDPKLVEALLTLNDPESTRVAIEGIKRVAARALHPDASGNNTTPEANKYLDDLLQSAGKLASLSNSELQILAKAYTKPRKERRSGAPKAQQQKFESADFHDGRLLESILEMAADSQASLPFARSRTVIVRPTSFSDSKPSSAPGEWYPPESSRVPIIRINEKGELSFRLARQVTFRKLVRYSKPSRDVAEADEYFGQIKQSLSEVLEPSRDEIGQFGQNDDIFLAKYGDDDITVESTDHHNPKIELKINDTLQQLEPGVYGLTFSDGRLKSVDDHFFRFESPDDEHSKTGLYIIGCSDNEYIRTLFKSFTPANDRRIIRPTLSAKTNGNDEIPLLTVPAEYFKIVQKQFEARITKGGQLLATDSERNLHILGTVASS